MDCLFKARLGKHLLWNLVVHVPMGVRFEARVVARAARQLLHCMHVYEVFLALNRSSCVLCIHLVVNEIAQILRSPKV